MVFWTETLEDETSVDPCNFQLANGPQFNVLNSEIASLSHQAVSEAHGSRGLRMAGVWMRPHHPSF
jgi:hypothetical protein